MSAKHPIVAVTGSSGAGTTSVLRTFEQIFRREGVNAVYVEGDSFHRYDRTAMEAKMGEERARGNQHFSHFSPAANLFAEIETLFRQYAGNGTGRRRRYLHELEDAAANGQAVGTFTAWEALPGSDLLFYEGLHGAVVQGSINIAQYPDLLIGVVPVINLEWIQKLHRDKVQRGYTPEAVADTILRRMPDYVNTIIPQFAHTHINIQRVPVVDTSNPFMARDIPSQDESLLVIRFANPAGIDFPDLLSMLSGSFMSRANTLVCPGGKRDLAMQLILTPLVWDLITQRKLALSRE